MKHNVGDIVYVPCKVVGIGVMAFTGEQVVDLVPIEHRSGEIYGIVKPFSIYGESAMTYKDFGK